MRTTTETANMSRTILIFLSKNGVFMFARTGTKEHSRLMHDGFLPCASTNTLNEAEQLQTATCKLSYDGKLMLYPLDGTLDGLMKAGEDLERLYLHHKSGAKGWPEGWGR